MKITYLKFHSNHPGVNEFKRLTSLASNTQAFSNVPMLFCNFNIGTSDNTNNKYRMNFQIVPWRSGHPLQWRHNDHDGVPNHQPHDCLLNRLFRRRSKKTSKLRVTGLCVGSSPRPVNSPHKGPVTRKMFPFDDVIMSVRTRPSSKVKSKWGANHVGYSIKCDQMLITAKEYHNG